MKNRKLHATAVCSLAILGAVGLVAPRSLAATHHDSIQTGITLTLWSWWQPQELAVLKTLSAQWGKAHGDKVVVLQSPQTFGFYATATRAGKGPDVGIAMPQDNLGLFEQEGLLLPASLMNPKLYPASIADGVRINGNYYAYPTAAQSVALLYNKHKISSPPKTWSAFVADANHYGFAMAQDQFYYDFDFIGGMGGYIFKDHKGTLNPNDIGLANKGAIAGYNLLHDMDWKYHWMNPSVVQSVALSEFDSGKVAMYLSGPWDVTTAQADKIAVGVAPFPTLPNGHAATPLISILSNIVSSRSHYPAAAQSLAQYLSNATAELDYFHADQDLPALLSLQKNKSVTSNPIAIGFVKQLNTGVAMPDIPQMQAVWSAQTIIPNIIKGAVSPVQGANEFVKNIKTGIRVQQG